MAPLCSYCLAQDNKNLSLYKEKKDKEFTRKCIKTRQKKKNPQI